MTRNPDGTITTRESSVFDVITEQEAANKKPKVLSSTLQKAEDEDFEALNTSASIVDDTQGFIDMIDNDQLDSRLLMALRMPSRLLLGQTMKKSSTDRTSTSSSKDCATQHCG